MRKFKQNKLWRDKLVDKMEKENGSRIHWCKLNDEEFDKELRVKLREEVEEVVTAKKHNDLVDELADVYEVIASLAELHHIALADIVAAQTKKRQDRGGFTDRIFVEVAEHPKGSFGEQYCLAQPGKYPEVL